MTKIVGFIVVRTPKFNFDAKGRGAFSSPAPRLGSIYYGGVDRMPWFDVDEHHYAGILPTEIAKLRRRIHEEDCDFSGIKVCQDLQSALTLFDYSQRVFPHNELIVVRSTQLASLKGEVDLDDSMVVWLGGDIVNPGSSSLLRAGLFRAPTAFPGWAEILQENGLFPLSVSVGDYVEAYEAAVRQGVVENELTTIPGYEIDLIEVGTVSAS